MKKTLITLAVISFLAGCSANPPKPAMPEGTNKTPINSTEKIEEFKAKLAEDRAASLDRSELQRNIEAMKKELADVKAYVALQQQEIKESQMIIDAAKRSVAQKKSDVTITALESVTQTNESTIFRIPEEYGKSAFDVSNTTSDAIVKAAQLGSRVVVRGRTDSKIVNAANSRIAQKRAENARSYLVKNGIDNSKIQINWLGAGDNIAENNTEQGRALNRRVEIEAFN